MRGYIKNMKREMTPAKNTTDMARYAVELSACCQAGLKNLLQYSIIPYNNMRLRIHEMNSAVALTCSPRVITSKNFLVGGLLATISNLLEVVWGATRMIPVSGS